MIWGKREGDHLDKERHTSPLLWTNAHKALNLPTHIRPPQMIRKGHRSRDCLLSENEMLPRRVQFLEHLDALPNNALHRIVLGYSPLWGFIGWSRRPCVWKAVIVCISSPTESVDFMITKTEARIFGLLQLIRLWVLVWIWDGRCTDYLQECEAWGARSVVNVLWEIGLYLSHKDVTSINLIL